MVRGRSARFLARLPKAIAESAGTSWYLTPVGHSYQSLLQVTSKIASDAPRLRSEGILLGQWGPSPPDDRVVVHLQLYSTEAAERLLQLFGNQWIMVSTQPAALVPTADDRFHDQAPFFGGDGIWRRGIDPIGTHYCGSGINMKSPVGTQYAATAGHCGSYTWKTNDTYYLTLGPTAVNYFSQTGGDFDFESISASTGGYVWGNNGYTYAVMGSTTPPAATKVTFDGIISGEV